MFVLTVGQKDISNSMLDELKKYQTELFSGLGLHFRLKVYNLNATKKSL